MADKYYATGHRKTAIAKVWLSAGTGQVTVNGRPAVDYFHRYALESMFSEPFVLTGTEGRFDIKATCLGGGIPGQAGALRHGIAKALVCYDAAFTVTLRRSGQLTRDPRVKERKHVGCHRARRGQQFSKR
jgi:small subunit ribosomal protein S9